MYHCLYSEKADKEFGHLIYRTVDGRDVKVTYTIRVNDFQNKAAVGGIVGPTPGYGWDDTIYNGIVDEGNPISRHPTQRKLFMDRMRDEMMTHYRRYCGSIY